MPFTCQAYGLTIRSDITLRGPLAAECDVVDVTMAAGGVPDRLERVETTMRHWSANARELLLTIPDVGRFHVRDGTEIRYERTPGASDDAVGGFLLGSCMGALLHQRGIPVLHGACVAFGDYAVAICGKSGRGKSTTAAWLVERGARMLSDDLAVFGSLDPPTVLPGYPQSKLTGAALDRLGMERESLRRVDEERGKFAVPRTELFVDRALPLGAIFVLETGRRGDLQLERLGGRDALRSLVKQTYRRNYVVPSRAQRHFTAMGRIASQVPVWLAIRPEHGDTIAELVSAIADMQVRAAGKIEDFD